MKPTNDATTAAKELFAERLKDKLAEYDIKQNALAEDLGVSESTVGKWILGKSMPRTMGMVEKNRRSPTCWQELFPRGKADTRERRTVRSRTPTPGTISCP